MRVRLGTEGGNERVILVTSRNGVYLSMRVLGRYYRACVRRDMTIHVGRS